MAKKEEIVIVYSEQTGRNVFEGLAMRSEKLASTTYHLQETIKCTDTPITETFTLNEGHKIAG